MHNKPITKFMKRSAYHQGMFFWVRALLINMPSLTVKDAVVNFMVNHGIEEKTDDNSNSLIREYHRIRKEYYEDEKTNV